MTTTTPQAFVETGFALTDAQHSQLETAIVVATGLAPLLPKNASLAITLASQLFAAVQAASASGVDVDDSELEGFFLADDAAKLADEKAQADKLAANAKEVKK